MVLSGKYLSIISVVYFDKEEPLKNFSLQNSQFNELIPAFFSTRTNFSSDKLNLYNFSKRNLDSYPTILSNWLTCYKKIEFQFQMFRFAISSIPIPVDVLNAFLLQILEPMYDLLNDDKSFRPSSHSDLLDLVNLNCIDYESPKWGNASNSYFKKCYFKDLISQSKKSIFFRDKLSHIFSNYGNDIFDYEKKMNIYNDILNFFVQSRNKIFHVKTCHIKEFSFYPYNLKISILLRHIFMQLIGIEYNEYRQNYLNLIADINKWIDTNGT